MISVILILNFTNGLRIDWNSKTLEKSRTEINHDFEFSFVAKKALNAVLLEKNQQSTEEEHKV
jgi:hypothetical protein